MELGRLAKIHDRFRASVATNGTLRIPNAGFEKLSIGVGGLGRAPRPIVDSVAAVRPIFSSERSTIIEMTTGRSSTTRWRRAEPTRWPRSSTVASPTEPRALQLLLRRIRRRRRSGLAPRIRRGDRRHRRRDRPSSRGHPDDLEICRGRLDRPPLRRAMGPRDLHERQRRSSDQPGIESRTGSPTTPTFAPTTRDFATTRRCCTGISRNCDSCFDTWEHFSWVILNPRKHLGSKRDFTSWLTTAWLFYFISRLIETADGDDTLTEIHRRHPFHSHANRHSEGSEEWRRKPDKKIDCTGMICPDADREDPQGGSRGWSSTRCSR